jgi:peptidoglycan/xylan/chitin deacetylase (PgdA/CDA1 family)
VKGVFTISLDFELHWGGFEKWPLAKYEQYFLNTREVIPRMLSLFEKYKVHATWATVGMLFCESREDLLACAPILKPSYVKMELSPYRYIDSIGIGSDEKTDPFHFAPQLIKQITATPYQELATHTFAHFYCNEPGQTVDQFRADIRAAHAVARRYGRNVTSLVFPRNQFNDDYLKICFEEGITAVRSNPTDWFWKIESTQNESLVKRLNRGLDAYFPIGNKNTYEIDSITYRPGYPVCLPASRLLRPYRSQEWLLNRLKINRIKHEMERAAQTGEVYHLWWHPHNFGNFPQQSLAALENILEHFENCRHRYNMKSLSMDELAAAIKNGK